MGAVSPKGVNPCLLKHSCFVLEVHPVSATCMRPTQWCMISEQCASEAATFKSVAVTFSSKERKSGRPTIPCSWRPSHWRTKERVTIVIRISSKGSRARHRKHGRNRQRSTIDPRLKDKFPRSIATNDKWLGLLYHIYLP